MAVKLIKTTILLCIISTGVGHLSHARIKCENVFQIETRKYASLETAFQNFLNKWNIQNQSYMFRINQDGIILERNGTRLWGANKEFNVYMVGHHKSATYVDYEVVNDFGDRPPVLLRATIEEFIEKVRGSFINSLKPEYRTFQKSIDLAIVPSQPERFDLGRIIKVISAKGFHEADVQFADGRIVKHSIDDLIKWNLQVAPQKLVDFANFLHLGGHGYIYNFPRTEAYGIIENQTVALVIQKLPSFEVVTERGSSVKFLQDERIFLEIQKMLNNDLPVFLSTSSLVLAFVSSADSPNMRTFFSRSESAKKDGLFLTERTTYDVLMHELVHLRDLASGFSIQLAKELEGPRKVIKLSKLGQVKVFQFVVEQRAHVHQYNVIFREGNPDSSTRAEKIFSIFNSKYQKPLIEYLNALDSKSRSEAIKFLEKWAMPSSELPLPFSISAVLTN